MPRVWVLLLKNSTFYNTTGPFFVQFTHKTPNKSTQQSNVEEEDDTDNESGDSDNED